MTLLNDGTPKPPPEFSYNYEMILERDLTTVIDRLKKWVAEHLEAQPQPQYCMRVYPHDIMKILLELENLNADKSVFMRQRDAAEEEVNYCEKILSSDIYQDVWHASPERFRIGAVNLAYRIRCDQTHAQSINTRLKEELKEAQERAKRYREERNHYRDVFFERNSSTEKQGDV